MAAYLLALWLVLGLVERAAALPPICFQAKLRVRALPEKVAAGRRVIIKAKVVTDAAAQNVVVRLDLPAGLVARPKSSTSSVIVGAGGGSAIYWEGLTLKAGKRHVLEIKARTCASMEPNMYSVAGSMYMVDNNNVVTCMSPPVKPAMVRRRGGGDLCSFFHKKQAMTIFLSPFMPGIRQIVQTLQGVVPKSTLLPNTVPNASW